MEIAKYLSIIFASMLKFFGGPITGLVTGVSVYHTYFLTILGMMISVITTTFFTKGILSLLPKSNNAAKKIFTKRTRFVVKIWLKYGLWGIAFLTPVILMPIGGTLLALSFKAKSWSIISKMFVAALLWGVLACWLIYKLTFVRDYLLK